MESAVGTILCSRLELIRYNAAGAPLNNRVSCQLTALYSHSLSLSRKTLAFLRHFSSFTWMRDDGNETMRHGCWACMQTIRASWNEPLLTINIISPTWQKVSEHKLLTCSASSTCYRMGARDSCNCELRVCHLIKFHFHIVQMKYVQRNVRRTILVK